MKVSAQYAEEHFADLLNAASGGEEVEITRPEKPLLKLVLSNVKAAGQATLGKDGKRILGAGRGEMNVPTWEAWKAMDQELAQSINDSALFPPETK